MPFFRWSRNLETAVYRAIRRSVEAPFTGVLGRTLKGSVVEEVDEFRDLGLLKNHHLSWNSHIDTITSKANRILGLIKRTCRGWKNTETLYCTLVRSQVEYWSVVWSPYTSRNIDKLERNQRRGTKFISRQNDISYEDRLKCLNMLSLEKRRYLFDVTF